MELDIDTALDTGCVFTFRTTRTLRPEYLYGVRSHKNCRVRDNCPPGGHCAVATGVLSCGG
jgi:hypothetical protein